MSHKKLDNPGSRAYNLMPSKKSISETTGARKQHGSGSHLQSKPYRRAGEHTQNKHTQGTQKQEAEQQIRKEADRMPSTVDLEHLEENITGAYLAFLRAGGINADNLEALTKIKHNTHDRALFYVFDSLFKADRTQINNQSSLLPYNDVGVLKRLIDIYYKLCLATDNDCTIQGFCCLTGFEDNTITKWSRDELNPERMGVIKGLYEKRRGMIENKLSDYTIGALGLANNSESLGLKWAQNSIPQNNNITAYILPGEAARQALEQRINSGALPKNASKTADGV